MEEFQWKKITKEEQELFKGFYEKEQSRSCEHSFANNLLWSPFYDTKYCVSGDNLLFCAGGDKLSVSFPIGKGDVKLTIQKLMDYFKEQDKPFRMHMVTSEQFGIMEELFPGKFQIEYDRDAADYIYESEKLISLAGKKLHGKRNHINRFLADYPDYQYESITAANKEECLEMANEWRIQNGCDENPDKQKEYCVTLNALEMLEELNLTGGLIRAGGRIVAFSIGEPLCHDTYVVHIEKAFADVQGAYPIMNQQFVIHEASQYTYINREEDTGADGLRQAKLSYHPVFMQEKGVVTFV